MVPVAVWGPSHWKKVTTYAFLDEGSNTTLSLQRLSFSLTSMNGVEVQDGVKVNFNLFGIHSTAILSMQDVVAVSTCQI